MLRIVGDINLTDGYFDVGFGVGSKLSRGFDPFSHIDRNDDDCWIGNFEGVASDKSDKKGTEAQQFRVSPDFLIHLKHFDLYGLANNHVMQHGDDAYNMTFDFLTSLGCRCFGSNTQKTQVFEHQGHLVSITGFSQRIDDFSNKPCYWHNPEYKDIESELRSIIDSAFKIVYIHWGNEFINYPSTYQKKFAHWLIDVGFDLVIGMHPHVLQGYELYDNKYIFYSLGNFVFDMAWEPTKYSMIVSIDLKQNIIIPKIDYIHIDGEFAPKVIDKINVPIQYRCEYLNEKCKININSEQYHDMIFENYKKYRKANHLDILYKMINHPSMVFGTLKDYAVRHIYKNI